MKNKFFAAIIVFSACFVFCLGAYASADEISDLKEKMRAIQEENRLLQDKLKNQEALIEQLSMRLEKLETKEVAPPPKEMEPGLLSAIPKMQVKGFGDISFKAERASNSADANPSTFTVGEYDFMVTSQLAEGLSFFSENVIEFGRSSTEIDIERLYLKYSLSDLLSIIVGRYHTPNGYWNTTFHHGIWFQTSASRPLLMEFEHDNGVLPLHIVGVDFTGRKDIGLFDFEYHLGIANGRDNLSTRVQNAQDKNDAKAFNSLLTLRPHAIPGLSLGFNVYSDKIPANTSASNRNGEIKELILGGYFAYLRNNWEVLFEGFQISHDDEVTQKDYDTSGLYLQAGYKLNGKYTPYYRFDLLDFGKDDPYFSGIDIDTRKQTFGIRWDITTWNALKLEYSHSDRKNASDRHLVTLNDSFHF